MRVFPMCSESRRFAVLVLALTVALSVVHPAEGRGKLLLDDQGHKPRDLRDLRASGHMLLWSGEFVRFRALFVSSQERCADAVVCLEFLVEDAPVSIPLETLSALEFVSGKALKLTQRSGRFFLAELPNAGPGKTAARDGAGCPPQAPQSASFSFSLGLEVPDPITGRVTRYTVPFCWIKQLSIQWQGKGNEDSAAGVEAVN